MARPIKKGLDYFPLDTKLDTKLKLVKANYGHKGFGLVIRLFQTIYSNGYYMEWDDDVESLFKSEEGFAIEDGFVSSIIEYCLSKKIFNKHLYDECHILTSKGIQERYLEAKTGMIYMDKKYFLLNYENFDVDADLIEVNSKKTIVFAETITQRKEKESREEQSKEYKNKRLTCSYRRFKKLQIDIEYEFDKSLNSDEYKILLDICSNNEIDLVECALRECISNEVLNIKYLEGIMKRFQAEGITAETYYKFEEV